jgi:transposase-like protein
MARMARTARSLEFKREAVAMATAEGASVAGVAKSLGLRPQTLQYWIDHPPGEAQRVNGKRASDAAPGSDDPAALKLRLKEAEQRIRRLEMERDILKKATAYFASQSP